MKIFGIFKSNICELNFIHINLLQILCVTVYRKKGCTDSIWWNVFDKRTVFCFVLKSGIH